MSTKLSTAIIPFTLAAALMVSGSSLAADTAALDHDHGDAPFELQLNAGEKWAIDAPLGKAMGDISMVMRAPIATIHEDRLPAAEYAPLAERIDDSVAYMVANCELPPEADAQLHMIIAQLVSGADKMAGNHADATPRAGAVQVLGALEAYARYFDDPDFVPVTH
ncbi:hypothetical protein [Halomonas sp. H10-9-1]|uniref:hypothetical protein n=1 Tax=Halomonas sp. H10-9-1 TaxID=2950871 RepID=UPI0032DF3C8D